MKKKFELLKSAVEEMIAGNEENSRNQLSLIEKQLDWNRDQDIIYLVFVLALYRRLDIENKEEVNLYLKQYETSQIDLFNLLATQLPLASIPGKIANHVFCHYIGNFKEISLLDIGIGTGRQVVLLLQELYSRQILPTKMTVFGIEPNKNNCEKAMKSVQQTAQEYGINLSFYPFQVSIEDLDNHSWLEISSGSGPLLVNAAFSLHHIRKNGKKTRENILQKIYQCNPLVFLLCEPNSDHQTDDLKQRFRNCFHHFSKIYQLIDRLEISRSEKMSLKLFFRREIEDIIANSDKNRFERHEELTSWTEKLVQSGFHLHTDIQLPTYQHPLVSIVKEKGYLGLKYDQDVLSGVVVAKPL